MRTAEMKAGPFSVPTVAARNGSSPRTAMATPAVTNVTTAVMVNMVARVSRAKTTRTQRPWRRYPSSKECPVAAAYWGPKRKAGNLTTLATITTKSMASPKVAPARVDCTRCETPTAAPAKRRPGPKAVQKVRVWAGAFTGGEVDR